MITVVRNGEICGDMVSGDNGDMDSSDTGDWSWRHQLVSVTSMVMLHWIMSGPGTLLTLLTVVRCQVGGAPVWTLTLAMV